MRAMVLNDGTTFSDVSGCKIVEIDDTIEGDDIDAAIEDAYHETDKIIAWFQNGPENLVVEWFLRRDSSPFLRRIDMGGKPDLPKPDLAEIAARINELGKRDPMNEDEQTEMIELSFALASWINPPIKED
jgi:hypothetical protein